MGSRNGSATAIVELGPQGEERGKRPREEALLDGAGSQRKRWSRAYETGGRESEFRQFRTECCDRTIPVSLMAVSGGELPPFSAMIEEG